MKKYDSYKDSGIEWIGEIPSHWEVKRGDAIFDLRKELITKEDLNGKEVYHYSIPVIQEYGVPAIEEGDSIDSNKYVVDGEEILFSKLNPRKGTITKSTHHNILAVASTEFVILKPKNSYINYLYYILTSNGFKNYISSLVESATKSHQRANPSDIYKAILPIAKPSEQTSIANFLDLKTSEIDEIIADKNRLLELYEEEKTAIINQAVTKGLDPNAPMKDSGIEWLGEIPEHWEVLPIKYVLLIPLTDGPHETPNLYQEGIPFISAEAIKGDKIDFSKMRGYISQKDHDLYSKKYKPQKGDVYMIKSGATTGNLARVETDEEFNIWSPLAAFRPNPKLTTTDFMFYYMKSASFFTAVKLGWNYGTQQNIGMNVLENLRIVKPPIKEQQSIVQHIESECSKIDFKKARTEELIELLTEYRTALISEAVTGKIKVTED